MAGDTYDSIVNDTTRVCGEEEKPESIQTTWAAGRYQTLGPLGRGGHGWVERARDVLTGDEVAIKWVRTGTALNLELARREVTTLRWLRLPGVVRLRDDGVQGENWFIVMDLVHGKPFPDTTTSWEELRTRMVGLLQALIPVHALGIVHGDLKPANIMVRPDGGIVLLDFGIVTGRALPIAHYTGGTQGFISPERIARLPCDARADLYAVGKMVLNALGDVDVPEAVRHILTAMVQKNREDRPTSAQEVLMALGERSTPPAFWESEVALRSLFVGPEVLLHRPSEAARILWIKTGGNSERIQHELERWEQEGLVCREGQRFRIGRLALEQIEQRPEEERLGRLLEKGSIEEVIPEALRVARWWKVDGRPRRAMAVLDRVLGRIRQEAPQQEIEILIVRTGLALSLENILATDEALVEIGRSPNKDARLLQCEQLLKAMRATLEGMHSHAAQLSQALSAFEDETLEIWRVALLVRAEQRAGRAEAYMEGLKDWAKTPAQHARWMGWMGNIHYWQGRYAESATCWLASLPGRTERDGRLVAQRCATMALLEVPDLTRARALADLIAAEARVCGHETLEAYATRSLRVAAYRLGEKLLPDEELVDAAMEVDPSAVGLFALCEAAIAWRARAYPIAQRIAERGERAFRLVDRKDNALLCKMIACASVGSDIATLQRLCQEAMHCRLVEYRMQIFALACLSTAHPAIAWKEQILSDAEQIPPARWALRLDVMSAEEAVSVCKHGFIEPI